MVGHLRVESGRGASRALLGLRHSQYFSRFSIRPFRTEEEEMKSRRRRFDAHGAFLTIVQRGYQSSGVRSLDKHAQLKHRRTDALAHLARLDFIPHYVIIIYLLYI